MSKPEPSQPRARRHASDIRVRGVPLENWPGPTAAYFAAPSSSPEEVKAAAEKHARYLVNKFALERYHCGESAKDVNVELEKRFRTTIADGSLWRMYARAVQINPATGNICGFWACVPHWRPRTEVQAPIASHHLSVLFAEAPKVEAALCAFILKRTTGPNMRPVSTLRPGMVWEVFLAECRRHTTRQAAGLWPFNSPRAGYEAVRRWFREKRFAHPASAARNELPVDLAKQVASDYKSAQTISAPSAHVSVAYGETQLDEHYMDQMWTVMVPGREPNEFVAVSTTRLWALCMVECTTTAVLSSGVTCGASYTTADVLRLIHSALVPPKRAERLRLNDPEWRYDKDAAYPAELPQFARNSWMTLAMDRHSTHRAALADAMEVTRCEVVSGRPAVPQARDTIERYFRNLATHADWFESAVGNHPKSPARRNPVEGALASVVYLPMAGEYLDILCRNYNVTPQVALDGDTPLGRLMRLASKGQLFRSPVGEFGSGNLYRLLPRYTARLTRRRSTKLGALCVYWNYACYVGPELSRSQHLMFGSTTEVDIYPQEDARFAFVVPRAFPEQVFRVVCTGSWRRVPHTHMDRKMSSVGASDTVGLHASGKPLTGVGLVRGLANAASRSEGLAQLVSGITSFMDRFGAGAVPYVDMSREQIEALLEYADKAADDADQSLERPWEHPQQAPPDAPPPSANRPLPGPARSTVPMAPGATPRCLSALCAGRRPAGPAMAMRPLRQPVGDGA